MSDLLPLFPLPNVVLFPNVFLPLHIFEPRYREMVADALGERSDDRHGAAAAGLGARLRRAAAGLPDRLQRRDHARRAARRRPLQHRAARPRAVPDRRGGPRAAATAARSSSRCASGRSTPTTAPRIRRQRSKLEALLAPAIDASSTARRPDADDAVGDGRRGSGQRAGAVSRSRAAREAGAARAARACAAAPSRWSSCSR